MSEKPQAHVIFEVEIRGEKRQFKVDHLGRMRETDGSDREIKNLEIPRDQMEQIHDQLRHLGLWSRSQVMGSLDSSARSR